MIKLGVETMIILGRRKEKYELKPDIIKHNDNVSFISKIICEAMDLPLYEAKIVNCAAVYHDIGKRNVDQELLYKPTKLTKQEFNEIKKHTRFGYNEMLRNPYLRNYAEFVLHHHENYNGGGYNNLKGTDIPMPSRILRVADYLDALCEKRPYREALAFEEALKIIEEDYKVFDPKVYDAFLKVLDDNSKLERILNLYANDKLLLKK